MTKDEQHELVELRSIILNLRDGRHSVISTTSLELRYNDLIVKHIKAHLCLSLVEHIHNVN